MLLIISHSAARLLKLVVSTPGSFRYFKSSLGKEFCLTRLVERLVPPYTNSCFLSKSCGVPPPTPPVGNIRTLEEKGMQQEVQSSI